MSNLSWNDIRARALAFSNEWADASRENADAKPFWVSFFNVFGLSAKRVASFEEPVKKLGAKQGFIDLFWKGVLLVEHKSRGKNLDAAYTQALDYFPGIQERDLPRYIIVSDFARIRLHDLENGEEHEFQLEELHQNIQLFGFIAGYQTRSFGTQDPVNIKAAELLGRLHDTFEASDYSGHALEVLLVRILFCLFAEDTSIFERQIFQDFIEQRTHEDGSDLGARLAHLFQVLNTPPEKRGKNLDDQLAAFPYVNGKLFGETLLIPDCNRAMREALLNCSALDWSRISPAIFGSLFQSVMDSRERRNLGAHYTTETNILKAIHPLFLDTLETELAACKTTRQLEAFHDKLAQIRVFDPACGCGNFLVIAYRELRRLELETLQRLRTHGQLALDTSALVLVDVDQFYGIEIEEFPAQIAQVALWLTDHQMNMRVSEAFGQYFVRLPLKKAPNIVHGNALRLDWHDVVAPEKLSYIVGNPPFIGAKFLNDAQRSEMTGIFAGVKNAGLVDYVSAWYRKATDYMQANPAIHAAFVSTNSITQGEQVGALWPDLLARGIKLHFAHRTFQWTSEARGKAAVHCVIIGFGLRDVSEKWIFEYDNPKSEPHAIKVSRINPYLVDAPDVVLANRSKPLCAVPEIGIGNKPIDGGHYLFTPDERDAFIAIEPNAAQWFRRWLGADEFINGYERWCLWLGDCPPNELRRMPEALKRVEAVKQFRLASKSAPTRKLAETPTRFHVENMPDSTYLLVPRVSSEKRVYVPIGFIRVDTLTSDSALISKNATPYHFGILTSMMHNAWMRAVAGRLESRYRYSAGIVYNNFPWPEPTDKQRASIEQCAQAVLDARADFPAATLADLYDPRTMPPELVKAHQALDKAVDAAYGVRSFESEAKRVAFLFERYQQLAAPLMAADKKPSKTPHFVTPANA
ncbi:MAG: class I SAM-dependent DNA methyltransferase [Halothiobacillaceae bacterium]